MQHRWTRFYYGADVNISWCSNCKKKQKQTRNCVTNVISVQRGLEETTALAGELSVHRCRARPWIPLFPTRLTNLDYFGSLIIHTSVPSLGLEEMVHAEPPWLWISFQRRACLFPGSAPNSRCGGSRGLQRRGAEGDSPAHFPLPERRLPGQHQRRHGPGKRHPGSPGPVSEEHRWAHGESTLILITFKLAQNFQCFDLKKKTKNRPNCVLSVSSSSDRLF